MKKVSPEFEGQGDLKMRMIAFIVHHTGKIALVCSLLVVLLAAFPFAVMYLPGIDENTCLGRWRSDYRAIFLKDPEHLEKQRERRAKALEQLENQLETRNTDKGKNKGE